MNDTLKVAGRIGAELGAAKAECERLRGLLEEAADDIRDSFKFSDLSHADLELLARIDAALSQQADPAETTEAYTAVDMATAAAQGFRDGQAAVEQAPVQDEQEVAAVIGFYEGEREPRLLSWNVLPNGEHRLYTRPAQTAPQPEQSGLRAIHAMILNALDRDAAEGKAVRGEMADELRAALSAQGGQ